MLGKSRNAMFFNGSCVRMARKVGSLKRRVRSHLVERLPESSVPPNSREAHLEVNMLKKLRGSSAFGWCDFEKVQAAVARSTCGSQRIKNWHPRRIFCKMHLRKKARRGGAKHIWKSRVWKYVTFGPSDYFRTLEIPKCVKSKRKKLRVFGHFCLSEQTDMDE